MTKEERELKAQRNIVRQLKEYGQSILIWPTGMGKTYTSMQIALNGMYNHVIYLSPFSLFNQSIIDNYLDVDDERFKLYTFAMLRTLHGFPNFGGEFDSMNTPDTLFIIDECHMVCAEQTYKALSLLKNEICPNAHYLGLTATPKRPDGMNPVFDVFNGRVADEYYLNQAIEDGILKKPTYIAGTFELDESLLKKKMKIEQSIEDLPANVRKSLNIRLQKMSDMDIRYTLEQWLPKDDYIKLIIFFPLKTILNERIEKYRDAFQTLFPDYSINVLKIYSGECEASAEDISNLKYKSKTIDIIASINMVSMGYHFDDLSCIIMDRATASQIVYLQQIGRCINITSSRTPLIFDIVGNYAKEQYSTVRRGRKQPKKFYMGDILLDKSSINFIDNQINFSEIERLVAEYQVEAINGWNVENIIEKYLNNEIDINTICSPAVLGISEERFLARVNVYKEKRMSA